MSIRNAYIYGFPIPTQSSAADDTLAEVQCDYCKRRKWIAYDLRYAGKKNRPAGIDDNTYARCSQCPSGSDHTTWTGRIRQRD